MSMEEMSGSGVGHVDSRQSGGGPDGETASGPPSDTTAVGRGAGGGRGVRPDTAADDFPVQERDDGRWVARVQDSRGKTVEYVFEGIDPDRWAQLLERHPPTTFEHAQFRQMTKVDAPPLFSEWFMCVALAESCVEPSLTAGQVALWTEEDPHTVGMLWAACLGANVANPFDLDGPWFEGVMAGG